MNNFTFYSPTLFTFGDGEEKNTGALVRRFGTAEAAYFADPGEYELLSLSERLCRSLADKSLERAERILGDCDRLGVTLLTYQDAATRSVCSSSTTFPGALCEGAALPL